MHFPVEGTRKTLLFFTVLTLWTIGFGLTAGEKTLNLKIGFDLTQGTNGNPSLRIHDFEGSDRSEYERNPRAEDKEGKELKDSPAIRADSFSDEKTKARQDDSSRDDNGQSSEGSDEDSGNNRRSTQGLRPGEYEPEDNPRLHGRYQDDEDESDDGRRHLHRNKREIDRWAMKRKSKKFLSTRR